jgi:Holliday junction resolvase
MGTEQQIQKKIIAYLEKEGCYVVKVVSATKSGVPDILGCYEGIFFGIEVKTPKTANNVSKLQEYNLDKIREADGHSLVAWSVDQVEEFLKGLLI